jgi:hypothetical protein
LVQSSLVDEIVFKSVLAFHNVLLDT